MRRAAGISSATVHDETILLDTRSGTYYTLNSTGAAVWGLLVEPRTLPEIEAGLVEEFSVERETLQRDLRELLEDMRRHRLIEEDG